MAGLEAAAALHPDRVEVDVQQTGDGTFVASHDTDLLVLAGRDEDIDAMSTAAVTSTTVRMHGNVG
ncbi:glycerophosphodiester phosphodiesterase family protein [Curtobacterium sp. MCPF17_050]|nr:glycerophosphodiester phosphodiesterase family protein [Curtobacterium sp. MCPF17_050]WIB17112.1 glycerophosphodiester phosphodiesterase family protein [Curtobacterium sp. MCPF17_050]